MDGAPHSIPPRSKQRRTQNASVALRLCLDRIVPPRKDRPISLGLPDVKTAADTASVMAAILKGLATGDITPSEAETLGKLIENYAKTLEVRTIEERITALEQRF